MTTKPGDKRTHEGEHPAPKASGWSKWKPLVGALAFAVGAASGQLSCGTNSPDTVINIPTQDGGTVDVTDGGPGHDSGIEADGGQGGADAGPDAADGGMAGMDAGPDSSDGGSGGMDAGTGGMDAGSGGMDGGVGGMDAGSGGMDAGPDATDGGMGGMDAGLDSGSGGSDSGAVACVSASTGQFVGTIGVAPRTVGGYVFSYEGQSGSDAVFSITCGGEAVQTDYHCPVGVTTEIDVPVDGKKISITPYSATATTTSCQIDVAAL